MVRNVLIIMVGVLIFSTVGSFAYVDYHNTRAQIQADQQKKQEKAVSKKEKSGKKSKKNHEESLQNREIEKNIEIVQDEIDELTTNRQEF